MKKANLLPLFTFSFCLGICLVRYRHIPFVFLYSGCWVFTLLALAFSRQEKSALLLLASGIFLGGLLLKNSFVLPNDHIAKLVRYKSDSVLVTGIIYSDPVYRNKKSSFILTAEKIKINGTWQSACGKVLVRSFRSDGLCYGDRLLLKGVLSRTFSFSKRFNYRNYLRQQGIYLVMSVEKGSAAKVLTGRAGNPLKALSFRIKHRLREAMAKNLTPFSAGILNAIILGERQNLPVYVRDILVKSGTVHIIAISGLHLGIVVFIVLLILKIIKIPRKPRYILTILLLIVYCILTGANTPVRRATIMAAILLLSYFLAREGNIYNSLSFAALIILAVNPWQLFEVSFQLSFLSVISIVWLSPKIKSIFPEKLNKMSWIRFLISLFSVSFAAWLGLLPLIAYYFRILSPITILANMIIVPCMTIIVASGFSLALIGMLIPSLSSIFAASNELFILILFKINSSLIAIPGAYFELPKLPFVYALVYYATLILIFNLPAFIRRLFRLRFP